MNNFIDTNILLRFLTRDLESKYQACKHLLEDASIGKKTLTTSSLVVFEVIWTLTSYYEEPKDSVVEKVESLLEFPNFEIENKNLFREALTLWQQYNVSFNDVFNYVWARKQKIENIYSYDLDFDKLPEIKRSTP